MPVDRQFFIGPDDEPDKYRLLRQVGVGGEAELWEADLAFAGERERAAVKILRAGHAVEVERWRERWAEQAELLRLIRHPGVVGVHSYFEGARMHLFGQADPHDRALYLVMNWVDGQSLLQWVPQHTRPEDRWDALRYLGQVAAVLDWLHSGRATSSKRPVVHGDISPANVIINPDGQAVVVDFGLFRMVRHVTVAPAGTHGYCAPEVLRSGEYSPASDQYAFGGLAYYVLTGNHPPTDRAELHAGLAIIAGSSDQRITVEDLAVIFAEDPDARPPAGEWIGALQMQSSTVLASPSPLPPPAPPGIAAVRVPADQVRGFPVWATATTTAAVVTTALVVIVFTVILSNMQVADPEATAGNSPPPQTSSAISSQTPTPNTSAPQVQAPQPGSIPVETSAQPAPIIPSAWLVDVDPVEGGYDWQRGPRNINGQTYERSLYVPDTCDIGTSEIAGYNLGRLHKRFHAIIGVADDASESEVIRFVVLLDGTPALTRDLRIGQQATVDLDVTDVLRLTLRLDGTCDEGAVWADPQLFR
jgi:serine/threonine protein kinase